MANVVAFENAKLPSFIKPKADVKNIFASLANVGFKVLSIKSKVFTVVDGETRTIVTALDSNGNQTDTPASAVDVVILAANPNKSRVYYKGGYEEGSHNKPDCYSNDGQAPAADAPNPQSKRCATCPHAQYGSRITESGKKSSACTEYIRLAVAPVGKLDDPMLLRVPPASIKALVKYGAEVAARGVEPHQVVTQIKFDYTVSHPALLFKPLRFVTEEMYEEILRVRESDVVQYIIGTKAMPMLDDDDEVESIAESVKQPVAPAPTPKAASVKSSAVETPATDEPAEEVLSSIDDLEFDD